MSDAATKTRTKTGNSKYLAGNALRTEISRLCGCATESVDLLKAKLVSKVIKSRCGPSKDSQTFSPVA